MATVSLAQLTPMQALIQLPLISLSYRSLGLLFKSALVLLPLPRPQPLQQQEDEPPGGEELGKQHSALRLRIPTTSTAPLTSAPPAQSNEPPTLPPPSGPST